MTAVAGQIDLFEVLEETKLDAPAPGLFASPARGLAARHSEYELWCAEYGSCGSWLRSRAWTAAFAPDTATARCQPTVLTADLRCDGHWREQCSCVGSLLYRGACRHCTWEGESHDDENAAAEDACDHAWPGWRELPTVPAVPAERKARGRWAEHVKALYPPGWLEDGGPIRTARTPPGTRHVPDRTPYGGYDLAFTSAP